MSRTFTEDFSQAKRDEVLALEMTKRLGDVTEYKTSTPEEDRAGIDAWIIKDGKRLSCDVKTYNFDWRVIRIAGWWSDQQQVVIELVGGSKSRTFEGEGADLILYHWRCLNPFIAGLEQTKRLMRKGFETHMWLERSFCQWLTKNWKDLTDLNIRKVNNTEGRGSMLLIGTSDIRKARQVWLNEHQTLSETSVSKS